MLTMLPWTKVKKKTWRKLSTISMISMVKVLLVFFFVFGEDCEDRNTKSGCETDVSCEWKMLTAGIQGCLAPNCLSTAGDPAQCGTNCLWKDKISSSCELVDPVACPGKIQSECASSGCTWVEIAEPSCTASCPAAKDESSCTSTLGCVYVEEKYRVCDPPNCDSSDPQLKCEGKKGCAWENDDCVYANGSENCHDVNDCDTDIGCRLRPVGICLGGGGSGCSSLSEDECLVDPTRDCYLKPAACETPNCNGVDACSCGSLLTLKTCTHPDCPAAPNSATDCDEANTGCRYNGINPGSCEPPVCSASPSAAADCQTGCAYVAGTSASCTPPTCIGATQELCTAVLLAVCGVM
jgi:hypothetical protein